MNESCLYEVIYKAVCMATYDITSFTSTFCCLDNAEYMAKKISVANDVFGDVNITNGLTGEIIATYNNGEKIYDQSED